MANINANKPLMPQRQNSHYVVVKEKHGSSSSNTTKTTASQNLKNAAKVSVLAQRSGKLGVPHYANGRNASIFGNRLSMKFGTYKGHVRSAESMYHNYRPTGSFSDMNAAMATAMAMQGLNSAMGLIGQGINAFKSPGNNPSGPTQKMGGGNNPTITPKDDDYMGRLNAATSFSEINATEKSMNTAKGKLQGSYNTLDKDIQQDIKDSKFDENINATLKDLGAELDISKLNLDPLPDFSNTPEDFDTALNTISSALGNFDAFSNDLTNALTAIDQAKGQLGDPTQMENSINNLPPDDPNIPQLKEKLSKLKEQIKKLEDAATAVKSLQTSVNTRKTDLEAKKAEVTKLKDAFANLQNKKYELAKAQDKQLRDVMTKIKDVKKKIASMVDKNPDKTTKADAKRQEKMTELNSQKTQLYTTLGQLLASLKDAGADEIANLSGQKINIKQTISDASQFMLDESGV